MTNEPLSTRRLLEQMRDLQRLATTRSEAEERLARVHTEALSAAAGRRAAAAAEAEAAYQQAKVAAEAAADEQRDRLRAEYEEARTGAQQEYHGLRSAAERDRKRTSDEARQRHQDEAMLILSTFDAQKGQPRRKLDAFGELLSRHREELAAIQRDAAEILKLRRLKRPAEPSEEPTADATRTENTDAAAGDAVAFDAAIDAKTAEIIGAIDSARDAVSAWYRSPTAKLLEGGTPAMVAAACAAAGVGVVGVLSGWAVGPLIGGGIVGGVAGWLGPLLALRPAAKRQAQEAFAGLDRNAAAAESALNEAAELAAARSRAEARELIERWDRELAELGFEIEQLVGGVRARTGEQLKTAGQAFPAQLGEMRRRHDQDVADTDAELRGRLGEVTSLRDAALAAAAAGEATDRVSADAARERGAEALRREWLDGYAAIARQLVATRERCDRLFPEWQATDYDAWEKPAEVSMGVEFGRVLLDLRRVKSGMPAEASLVPTPTQFELPAMITLLEQPSLVIHAEGPGRRRATELMQAVMLHWITCQPPGKVRFTVLDPVGLGEGFNSFMHLADYQEGLIATRIWSQPRDIDEQLVRLTHHMETVLQKYLRSEYESIHEYNQQAGEVAEPFQVLVVHGFPTGFGDDTAQKLARLATNGPRCGVYVVMAIDTKQRLPTDFPMEDLLENAARLDWQPPDETGEGRFVWQYPALGKMPLRLASAPSPERMVGLMKQVGRAAADAVRVEVPFEVVAPEPDAVWARDCSDELLAPIGRAGANRLQDVRLGKGTSQHLLVAGKTGSGKSTFLHALVTSAAMHYSPDEVEFYLVDFKKGVEFKSYATNNLPHARVVAIESEREFGLSVLQRLDEELSRRGELYRASGVQSLADFRAAHPDTTMPRVLLVIDEFQELFVEDDKLAQDATLLLDRLVRQGRAFGMHVVLGTQTLAGAYSIARSTLGQIAIRVALACGEADAHLILSDERNTAARFLSRPGEAIYNDQNGLATANELFQVVWLPDRERTERLADVNAHRESLGVPAPPMVVFEGNAPADPLENEMLRDRIADFGLRMDGQAELTGGSARLPSFPNPNSAFLGDAVAIKPPTVAPFGRHGGANLLIVGPDERSALGMLSVGVVSLAAGAADARVVVLDATRAGDASEGVWRRVAEGLPSDAVVADAAGAAQAIADLAAEVARREAESDDAAPPVYLVIYNAGRFRDLRRSEDDFSFSMDADKPKSPDKRLAEVLKSGPGVGVHVLAWCDSYNACSRLFDRVALREFAMRVVMQMSAADSSNLIDTPAASHLKPHRALFYSDETGDTEKLRPYGPPSEAWLESVKSPRQQSMPGS
ncbi:MAG: FtsK/SpoIIIE domain-containing protein [Planctomycetota bacterium]